MALIEHLNYKKVHLIGTSGGAYVALNVALERPKLVQKVVADSFEGRTLHEGMLEELIRDREVCVHNEFARQFYNWCQGEDWQSVVEADTQAISAFIQSGCSLYHKPLKELTMPLLLLGSKEDTSLRKDLFEEYQQISKMTPKTMIHMFERGGHPSLLSNCEEAIKIINTFLE